MIDCPSFANCNASLCPLADNLKDLIWYPDEDICGAKRFQSLDWVRKQKTIAKVKADQDRYFTVEMLKSVRQVRKGLVGVNPDQSLKQAKEKEAQWIAEHKTTRRVIANQNLRCQ